MTSLSKRIIGWQKTQGRHDLPWQIRDPYIVWVAEIMLQQTQVTTVLDYFPRFIATFPNVTTLARAKEDDVMALWAGLGYYRRARHLQEAAQTIVHGWQGQWRTERADWQALKGIGRSTAAAICAFAFLKREAILDGNVKRILCRYFAINDPIDSTTGEKKLWALAESLLPENPQDMPAYTQGLMDLGALICRPKPQCHACCLNQDCMAHHQQNTACYPVKQQRSKVVEQTQYWLVIFNHDQQVHLTKRGNDNIWAGLMCVPIFASQAERTTFCQQQHLPNAVATHTLRHRLTHRLLMIDVTVIYTDAFVGETYPITTHLALPTPLKHLLEHYQSMQGCLKKESFLQP